MKSIAPMKTNAAQTTRALTDCVNPIASLLRVYRMIIIGDGVIWKRNLCCGAVGTRARISIRSPKALKNLSEIADS
jgi:hypothetical protein